MKVQYCSDLHLEFRENKEHLKRNKIKPVGEILILAGDIVPFCIMNKHADFFRYIADNFESTYWIPGNHEYYHSDIIERSGMIQEKIKTNVCLVNNLSIQYNNMRFIFSTLWSHIGPAHEWQIEKGMNDFRLIRHNDYRFSCDIYNKLHEKSLNFITKEVEKNYSGSTVVVTHHVPTFFNYPPRYKGDILNEAFGVELYGLIESADIDCWIYGHHHHNTPDFIIGKTRMLTNQLGYVQQDEHHLFDNGKVVII